MKSQKKKWMVQRCKKLEELINKGNSSGVYRKINKLAGVYRKSNISQLTDDNGELITEESKVAETWREYLLAL